MQKKVVLIAGVVGGVLIAAGITLFAMQGKVAAGHFEKAQQIAASGNPAEVIAILEKVNIKRLKGEDRLEALVLLGKSHTTLGNKQKARKMWERILATPDAGKAFTDVARFNLALLNQETNPQESQTAFAELAQSSQDSEVASGSLLEIAKTQAAAGDMLAARESFKKVIDHFPGCSRMNQAVAGLSDANTRLLFSKIETPYSAVHVVKSGESLALIAQKYNMTVELLMESNGLKSDAIRKGDRLKVCTATFSILVDKSQNTLTLKANEELFKIYLVGTGKEGSTPIGEFQITNKLPEPTWFHPQGGVIPFGSKENLLGTRWIGINSPGYGIHGTWEPDSVGKQSSAGCIRLVNEQVEELYKIVTVATPVTIVE